MTKSGLKNSICYCCSDEDMGLSLDKFSNPLLTRLSHFTLIRVKTGSTESSSAHSLAVIMTF